MYEKETTVRMNAAELGRLRKKYAPGPAGPKPRPANRPKNTWARIDLGSQAGCTEEFLTVVDQYLDLVDELMEVSSRPSYTGQERDIKRLTREGKRCQRYFEVFTSLGTEGEQDMARRLLNPGKYVID